MTKKFLYSLFAFALLFAIACRKDSIVTDTKMEPTPPIITIETSVLGVVADLDGNVLEGALLTLGNAQTTSDENGYFKLSGFADDDNAIIKVQMAGYFDAWHAFEPFTKDIAQTKIRLTPRINPLIISANAGGEVQFDNAKVNFQGNSFVDESGNAYTGNVSVFTSYLDPTDPNLHTFMPGNLTAFDASNRLQLLETFGMINVELEGDAGQKLQINQPATIEMLIPASILNKAPTTIPLWYFDTEKQRWVEEGSATLQGGRYIGTVAHFSFWNCDVPNNYIQLDGQAFLGESGASLLVCVTNLATDEKRCTYTSANDGYFGGKVPPGEELFLEIFSECGDLVYAENIGPFTVNATVGPYSLNATQSWALVHGNVVNCDADPVTNGYVLANWGNNQSAVFSINANGEFSKFINTCNATEITLKAVDTDNHKSGDPANFALSVNADVGILEACVNDIVNGVFINYGGNDYAMFGTTISNVPILPIDTSSIYSFVTMDDQGNGNKILYEFHIINWTGQPMNVYGFSYNKTIFGSPTTEFDFGAGDISLIESGQMPNEYVIFELTNFTVTLNGTNYPGGSMQIVGLIQ